MAHQEETLTRGQQLARWGAVRVRYENAALPIHLCPSLCATLMMEFFERCRKAGVKFTDALRRTSWDEAYYCLDAPEDMPAGACRGFDLGDDIKGVEQITFRREPPTWTINPKVIA